MLLFGTIANLPKCFTRIHSSLLEISAERPLDRALGRPRIRAESSFFAPPSACVYRRGEFIRYSARERAESTLRFLSAGPCSTPLPHARLIRNAHGLSAVTRIFYCESTITLACLSGWNAIFIHAKIRDNLSRGRLFKLCLHPAPLRFFRFSPSFSFFSSQRNEIIPLLSVCTGVSSPFARNDIITRWFAGSFEPTPRSWVN